MAESNYVGVIVIDYSQNAVIIIDFSFEFSAVNVIEICSVFAINYSIFFYNKLPEQNLYKL